MNAVFHPEARAEFFAASEFYDQAVSGLGDPFFMRFVRRWRLRVNGRALGASAAPVCAGYSFPAFRTTLCIRFAPTSSRCSLSRTTIGALGTGANVS